MNKKDKPYLPKERANYSPKTSECQSSAKNGETTNLPNPAVDPIVCNNIATQEFDYTQDMREE